MFDCSLGCLSEGSAPRHLHYSILLTCLLGSHCHRNRVPESSGGSFCSGASKGEDRGGGGESEGGGVRRRSKEAQREKRGETEEEREVRDQERKSERHCHW